MPLLVPPISLFQLIKEIHVAKTKYYEMILTGRKTSKKKGKNRYLEPRCSRSQSSDHSRNHYFDCSSSLMSCPTPTLSSSKLFQCKYCNYKQEITINNYNHILNGLLGNKKVGTNSLPKRANIITKFYHLQKSH